MATIIFPLRGVPEEEAQGVRDLLDREKIDWYETTAGNWGISNPAIWLQSKDDFNNARSCIDQYQQKLTDQAIQVDPTDWHSHIKNKPIAVILATIGIAIITYFSISPFFSLFSSE